MFRQLFRHLCCTQIYRRSGPCLFAVAIKLQSVAVHSLQTQTYSVLQHSNGLLYLHQASLWHGTYVPLKSVLANSKLPIPEECRNGKEHFYPEEYDLLENISTVADGEEKLFANMSMQRIADSNEEDVVLVYTTCNQTYCGFGVGAGGFVRQNTSPADGDWGRLIRAAEHLMGDCNADFEIPTWIAVSEVH